MPSYPMGRPLALCAILLATPLATLFATPAHAQIGIGVNITVAPPPLPVYEPPPLPGPGYLWSPGYWAYGEAGYYWVPGTWVLPPTPGLLWTPGYWGWRNGFYAFNAGYWGPHVGFYGGINYGFGFFGVGFAGGEWRGGSFFYNTAVFHNFGGAHITNVYNQTVINRNVTVNNVHNVSFNGPGGVSAQPTAQERAFAAEPHVQPTAAQTQHQQLAAANPALRQSVNHGAPAIAATSRPGEFHGPGVVGARGAPPSAVQQARGAGAAAAPREAAAAGAGRAALPAVSHPSGAVHGNYAAAHAAHAAYHGTQAAFAPRGVAVGHPLGAPAYHPRPVAAPRAGGHGGGGGRHK